jgi:fucose 4-O-acetylase-like acetyltransferase
MTSLWAQAAGAAARTPDTRNRYVDFLRAVSILAVISGHWLMAAPWVSGGGVRLSNLLEYRSWTHFLTWVFQVMPVFFLVGGYSNGVSWKAAVRDGKSYADWLNGRLQRLLGPVMPLLVVWVVLGAAGTAAHVEPVLLRAGSQMALVPIWFLAVYTMAVVLVPFTYAAWHRFGMGSFWALALAAVLDDVLFFGADLRLLGWLNYGFVWLAVHQLGYAWREGWFAGTRRTLVWAATGLLILVALVTIGPYPVSMVSVPGEDVSNTLPPKLPMLLIGVVQSGLLISIEAPMRRWLRRITPWTATVLVNGMIMTIFLWHLTASTLLIGGAMVAGDIGLTAAPGSPGWWLLRPVWLAVYLVALAGLAMIFGRFERDRPGISPAAPWRQVLGAAFVCGGLAFLALDGVAGSGVLGIRPVALLPFVGAALASVTPFGRTAVRTAA